MNQLATWARVSTGFGLAALLSIELGAQNRPVFRSSADAVRVDVSVMDGGRPVAGLTGRNFKVFDNGVEQQVDVLEESVGVHTTLLMDTSGSVAGTKLRALVDAGSRFVSALNRQDSAILLSFTHRISMPIGVTDDKAPLLAALKGLQPEGRTALYDGVYAAYALAARYQERSMLLVFSDGRDNASWLREGGVLESIRRSDVVVYPVAVADFAVADPESDGRLEFLKRLADGTGGQVFTVGAAEQLGETFLRVLEEFRTRYILLYSPQGVRRGDGWHTLKVSLKGTRAKVKARPGYFASR